MALTCSALRIKPGLYYAVVPWIDINDMTTTITTAPIIVLSGSNMETGVRYLTPAGKVNTRSFEWFIQHFWRYSDNCR